MNLPRSVFIIPQGLSKVNSRPEECTTVLRESLRTAAGGEEIPTNTKREIASGATRPRNDGRNSTYEKP